jgi:hypothetical protein
MSRDSLDVACRASGDGWVCDVGVGDDPGATLHRVSVTRADLAALAGGDADTGRLVRASFAYLLEREPRESILASFDLPVIGRYFPSYRTDIARRLARQ